VNLDLYDTDPGAEERRARIKEGFRRLIAEREAKAEADPESARNRHRRIVAKANAYWDARRPNVEDHG
jgi:hypothetical protein